MARFEALVLAACLAALIQTSFAATSHTVGGTTGWAIPSSNGFYSSWASNQTFKVGDTLVFNFQTATHTVAEVSKSDYDACTTTNPISTATTGPASISLSTAGTHYYICTVTGHCSAGQKLAVTATTTATAAPTAAPTAAATSPATSPASSPASSPATSPASSPATSPASSPATSPTPSIAATPVSAPFAAPTPSFSPDTAPTPSSSTTSPPMASSSPSASSVPSALSPSDGTTAPAPSAAAIAGAGLMMPIMMIAAAFLV